MATPNRVKALAEKLGFNVSALLGSEINAHYTIRATKTAAPFEVYFTRADNERCWLWAGAIHRVHWSDPIARFNEGQPELNTFTAFKAYLSLFATTLKETR